MPTATIDTTSSTTWCPTVAFHITATMQFPSTSPQHSGRISPRPPPYQQNVRAPPPAGFRIPLDSNSPFPPHEQAHDPPCRDLDGSPVYFGSALLRTSVHPCKVAPHVDCACRVPYGGQETAHRGRYDLLPFTPHDMELVPTSGGRIPPGRRPIEGGYEESGQKLYHGLVRHRHGDHTVLVPGKVGEHLGGCNYAFGDQEHFSAEYELLCWK